ncbi:MAG TPA: twin-arginine translocation signal domain-containing protein [Steroidobacteraceae bacterium]|jgi:hypothetical protein|nr:twin-arginine translocation signal domain-containing protein [Steroidobacteraceae bacterium]
MSTATRREFLGGVSMSVAAAVALSLTPGARAVPLRWSAPHLPPALATMYPQGDWHVDDICGHLPRYAHPIPYLHDTTAPDFSALAAPVDRQFVS